MGCLLLVLLAAALVLLGFGFVVHVLWIIAAIFFGFWVAGYAFARGQRRGGRRRF
ncbi:MAG TPA: hypothetical protein VKU86_05600 [Acidimicrobiales bacterium]|nr:hypothetical protein [Acidimicrobiales bacterium]